MTFDRRYVQLQGRHRLQFSLLHQYELIQGQESRRSWSVRSVGYWYQVRQEDGPEIIAFHWHPRAGRSHIPFPHLHVGRATLPIDLGGKHIPTGQVTIDAVIRFLVAELHVRPLRADWAGVLSP